MWERESGFNSHMPVFGNDLFMSKDIRHRVLARVTILTVILNSLVGLISYFELSQPIFLYQLAFTISAGTLCYIYRKRFPNLSIILISTAFIFGVCFYLVRSPFNQTAILNLFPLIALCVYFLLGRVAAIFYSLLFGVLSYFVTSSASFYVKYKALPELIIYFTILAITFCLIYFIRLQIILYEQRIYNTEENLKLQDLTANHKENIAVLIQEISENLDQEFMDQFQATDPKSSEIFQRAFQRIQIAIDEIHRLGKRQNLISKDKVYEIWPAKDKQ